MSLRYGSISSLSSRFILPPFFQVWLFLSDSLSFGLTSLHLPSQALKDQVLIPTNLPTHYYLGPMGDPDPTELICAETDRLALKHRNPFIADWTHAFRSWPTMVPGWRDWYLRVSASKANLWADAGISHAIRLTLADIDKSEPSLIAASFFWSDALNAFLFGHGPATPTLLDVVMITDTNITSTLSPGTFRIKPSHKLETKNVGGWRKYIQTYSKSSGPVNHKEHSAFLMMWLDHFFFCGSSVGPTGNYQGLAESLADGRSLPLGQYLLGATYLLLHQVSAALRKGGPVKNMGGPWWFLQLWLSIHSVKARGINLADCQFPSDHPESAPPQTRRCVSYGEAAAVIKGEDLSADTLSAWFSLFHKGFSPDSTLWFSYGTMELLEYDTPGIFDPLTPMTDPASAGIFTVCVRPRVLPTGLGFGGRLQHYSYEFYHPTVAARQLGCGQLPPSLFFVGQVKARAPLEGDYQLNWVNRLAEGIPTGTVVNFRAVSSSSRIFRLWWEEWRKHIYSQSTASCFSALDLEVPAEEVSPFYRTVSAPSTFHLMFSDRLLSL